MKKIELDAIDIRILSAIQAYGSLSKTQLAEQVNLSPTPCWTRLHKLKAAGLIKGYHADIALDGMAELTQVMVTLALDRHRKADFSRFETYIQTVDEITECVATGGGMDYVLKVYCISLADFQRLMESLLDAELGIHRYMTYIVTRTVKISKPNLTTLLSTQTLSDTQAR